MEHDGVEGIAARLDADVAEGLLAPGQVQQHRERERLGDGLEGERCRRVADRDGLAAGVGDRDAEAIRVGLGKLGDVVGQVACRLRRVPGVEP
jgi:hypothetical protein